MKKLTLALIVIAAVVTGCKTSKVSGSEGDVKESSDARAAVIQASRKLIALKSLSGKIEADAETPYTQQVQFVAPDRYHVAYRDKSGSETEMVMAGKDAYVKSGDSWNETKGDTNPTPTMLNSFTEQALESISNVKSLGEESVNGVTASVYSYKLVTVVGNFPVTQKIWVAKSTGLPVKCVVEYTSGPIKTLTTTFDTQSPVTIEFPPKAAPAKTADRK